MNTQCRWTDSHVRATPQYRMAACILTTLCECMHRMLWWCGMMIYVVDRQRSCTYTAMRADRSRVTALKPASRRRAGTPGGSPSRIRGDMPSALSSPPHTRRFCPTWHRPPAGPNPTMPCFVARRYQVDGPVPRHCRQ